MCDMCVLFDSRERVRRGRRGRCDCDALGTRQRRRRFCSIVRRFGWLLGKFLHTLVCYFSRNSQRESATRECIGIICCATVRLAHAQPLDPIRVCVCV